MFSATQSRVFTCKHVKQDLLSLLSDNDVSVKRFSDAIGDNIVLWEIGMTGQERREKILTLLDEQGKVNVSELAKDMNVSDKSIRRDLQELEDKGLLVRFRGGAVKPEDAQLTVNQMKLDTSIEGKAPGTKAPEAESPEIEVIKGLVEDSKPRVIIKKSKPEWLRKAIDNQQDRNAMGQAPLPKEDQPEQDVDEKKVEQPIKESEQKPKTKKPKELTPDKKSTQKSKPKQPDGATEPKQADEKTEPKQTDEKAKPKQADEKAEPKQADEKAEPTKPTKDIDVIEVGSPITPEAKEKIMRLAKPEHKPSTTKLDKTKWEEASEKEVIEPAPVKESKKKKRSRREASKEKQIREDKKKSQGRVAIPDKEEKIEKEAKSDTEEIIEKEAKPGTEEQIEKEAKPVTKERRDKKVRPDREKRLDKEARSEKEDRLDKEARPEKETRPEKEDRLDKEARPDKKAKPEKEDRLDKVARTDKEERLDKEARPDGEESSDIEAKPDKGKKAGRKERPEKEERKDKERKPDRKERIKREEKSDRKKKPDKERKSDRKEKEVKEEKTSKGRTVMDSVYIILALICLIGGIGLSIFILQAQREPGGGNIQQEQVTHGELTFYIPRGWNLLDGGGDDTVIRIRDEQGNIIGAVTISTTPGDLSLSLEENFDNLSRRIHRYVTYFQESEIILSGSPVRMFIYKTQSGDGEASTYGYLVPSGGNLQYIQLRKPDDGFNQEVLNQFNEIVMGMNFLPSEFTSEIN